MKDGLLTPPTADPTLRVADDVVLGNNVRLAGFANLYGCTVGNDTFIGPFVEIQRGAHIGARCKIQSHSFICEGVTVEDEAFVGHGVMFINDLFPRSTTATGVLKKADDWTCVQTRIGRRASIGSNATILAGISIGDNALIAAGAVVTRDVPAATVVAGNPARTLRALSAEELS